jgi:hypothetical protein
MMLLEIVGTIASDSPIASAGRWSAPTEWSGLSVRDRLNYRFGFADFQAEAV